MLISYLYMFNRLNLRLMETNKGTYVTPTASVVELLFEGTVLTGSQVVGGGSESGGFEDEE